MKRSNVFRKVFVGSLFLLGTVTVLNSCGGCNKDGDKASTTPEEAMINYASNENCQMALTIRFGDLIKKSGLEGDLLPADMKMMADSFLGQYLDSEQTGIDLNGTCYMYGDFAGVEKGSPNFLALSLPLTNAETFGAFVEGQTRMSPEEGEGYSFVKMKKSGLLVWNNGFAALVTGKNVMKDMDAVMKAMTSKGKKNTSKLENFAAKKSDFGFYMDFESFMKVMPQDPKYGDMMNSKMMKDMMKDSYISGTLNFEKGKVELVYAMDFNSKLQDFISKAYKNGNPAFAKYLGGDNLIGFGAMSLNLNEILGFYEEIGFFDSPEIAEQLKQLKEKSGISLMDIISKFSGDFSIAFVDLVEDKESEEEDVEENEYAGFYEKRKETKPVLTMAIGINDQEINKVFDTIPGLKNVNGVYRFPTMGGMAYKNSILFATTDEALLNDFAEDGELNEYTKNNAKELISSNSVCGYMNFQALATAMADIDAEAAEALSKLDYAEFTVTKDAEMKAVLYMKDKSVNSLKSLGKIIIDSAMSSGMAF